MRRRTKKTSIQVRGGPRRAPAAAATLACRVVAVSQRILHVLLTAYCRFRLDASQSGSSGFHQHPHHALLLVHHHRAGLDELPRAAAAAAAAASADAVRVDVVLRVRPLHCRTRIFVAALMITVLVVVVIEALLVRGDDAAAPSLRARVVGLVVIFLVADLHAPAA